MQNPSFTEFVHHNRKIIIDFSFNTSFTKFMYDKKWKIIQRQNIKKLARFYFKESALDSLLSFSKIRMTNQLSLVKKNDQMKNETINKFFSQPLST